MSNFSINNKKNNVSKKKIYYFSSASSRILARCFDTIFLFLIYILLAFFYYFLCNPSGNVITNMTRTSWWQLDVYSFLIFSGNFCYFIVLPFFWKGQTLFSKVFQIKIIYTSKNKHFFRLIYRELFLWIDLCLLFLLTFLILTFCSKDSEINQVLRQIIFQDMRSKMTVRIACYIFRALVILCFSLNIFIFANTIYNSHYQTMFDLKTGTAVVDSKLSKKNCVSIEKKVNQSREVELPGKMTNQIIEGWDKIHD